MVGLAAGMLTTIAFIPQVLKTWRSRNASELSLVMFVIFTIGIICWLTYGILRSDIAIIIWNTITLILSVMLLYFKLTFK
jgi:MtN3 and saliva related transmembrane protein